VLFWETVGRGVGCHLVPHVERVLRPLRQFLRHQCAASGDCAILCDAVDRGRVVCRLGVNLSGGGLRCRAIGQRDAALFGNRGDESFEVLLLVLGKAWVFRHPTRHA